LHWLPSFDTPFGLGAILHTGYIMHADDFGPTEYEPFPRCLSKGFEALVED